ncbi:hypothetical protein DSUL_150009 [Desulfovibrionales bacterium]
MINVISNYSYMGFLFDEIEKAYPDLTSIFTVNYGLRYSYE